MMGDQSNVATPLGTVVFTVLLSAVVVAMRIWTQNYTRTRLGVDDYLAIVSLFIILGTGITVGLMTQFGLGRHQRSLSDEDLFLYRRGQFVSLVFYTVGLFTVKMTILFQYLKALNDDWRKQHKLLFMMLLVGLWAISEFWVNIFRCLPVSGAWDVQVSASCIPAKPYQYVYIAGDIVSAAAIFILPAMLVRRVVIGWAEALVLAMVYTLGLFVVVLQFVRLRYVDLGDDYTWTFAERASLIMAELSVALFCACSILLHPLAERFCPRYFNTFTFEDPEAQETMPPWSPDIEKAKTEHPEGIMIPGLGASANLSGFGSDSRQKIVNYTPRDQFNKNNNNNNRIATSDLDDSGDLSDEIIGLQSTRKAMKRISLGRSLSESDVSTLSRKRHGASGKPAAAGPSAARPTSAAGLQRRRSSENYEHRRASRERYLSDQRQELRARLDRQRRRRALQGPPSNDQIGRRRSSLDPLPSSPASAAAQDRQPLEPQAPGAGPSGASAAKNAR